MNLYRKIETFIVCMIFTLFGYLHWCYFMTGIVFYIFLGVLNVFRTKPKNLILQKIIGGLCGCNSSNILDFLI